MVHKLQIYFKHNIEGKLYIFINGNIKERGQTITNDTVYWLSKNNKYKHNWILNWFLIWIELNISHT